MAKEPSVSMPLAIAFIIIVVLPACFLLASKKSSMTILNERNLKARIKKEEGFRATSRFDSSGVPVSGYGHRSSNKSSKRGKIENLTEEEAVRIFEADFEVMKKMLIEVSNKKNIKLNRLSTGIINALCDLTFYVGKKQMLMMDNLWATLESTKDDRAREAAKVVFDLVPTAGEYKDRTLYNAYLMITNIDDDVASNELTAEQKTQIQHFLSVELFREDRHRQKAHIITKFRYGKESECPKDMFFQPDIRKCLDRLHCTEGNYKMAQRWMIENHECQECNDEFFFNGVECAECPEDHFTTVQTNYCHPKSECQLKSGETLDRVYIRNNECFTCPPDTVLVNYNCVPCAKGSYSLLTTNECVKGVRPSVPDSGAENQQMRKTMPVKKEVPVKPIDNPTQKTKSLFERPKGKELIEKLVKPSFTKKLPDLIEKMNSEEPLGQSQITEKSALSLDAKKKPQIKVDRLDPSQATHLTTSSSHQSASEFVNLETVQRENADLEKLRNSNQFLI